MTTSWPSAGRLTLLVACAALAFGIAACGDSGDSDPKGGANAATSADQTTAQPAPETPGGKQKGSGRRHGEELAQQGTDGGSGGQPAGGSPQSGAGQADDGGQADGQADQVAATVNSMYAGLAAGDAAGVCAAMSRKAQGEIASGAVGGGAPGGSCTTTLAAFLAAARQSGALGADLQATVEDVAVDGSVATVTVELGGRKGKVDLIREGGSWRFEALPAGSGAGG